MSAFTITVQQEDGQAIAKLDGSFADKDWGGLIEQYKAKIADGIKSWILDLTNLQFISSNSIGLLIALNTSAMANEGGVQLILKEGSQVATQIKFAKIDLILKCNFEG